MQPIFAALRTFLHLALPYFRSEERWQSIALNGFSPARAEAAAV